MIEVLWEHGGSIVEVWWKYCYGGSIVLYGGGNVKVLWKYREVIVESLLKDSGSIVEVL